MLVLQDSPELADKDTVDETDSTLFGRALYIGLDSGNSNLVATSDLEP